MIEDFTQKDKKKHKKWCIENIFLFFTYSFQEIRQSKEKAVIVLPFERRKFLKIFQTAQQRSQVVICGQCRVFVNSVCSLLAWKLCQQICLITNLTNYKKCHKILQTYYKMVTSHWSRHWLEWKFPEPSRFISVTSLTCRDQIFST